MGEGYQERRHQGRLNSITGPTMTTSQTLHLLSGGAAQGLVGTLEPQFLADQGCSVSGGFGAVGVMKDRLLSGEPCDVVVLTDALITQLTASGHLVAGGARALGVVQTGIAVKAGEPAPHVNDADALKAALLAATGVYFPDAIQSTAGIHFMKVLKALGIDAALGDRLKTFPNGATAMGAMAQSLQTGLIGCTQMTEILHIPGVTWVAPLPPEFELATVYTAAVCTRAAHAELAMGLVDLLSRAESGSLRQAAGFA